MPIASDDKHILLIRTGGTFDAEPYDDPRNPPKYVTTRKGANSLVIPTVETLPNHENVVDFRWVGSQWNEEDYVKDSQLFTRQDIRDLANIIKDHTDQKYIIITHGTDNMATNSLMLREELEKIGVTDRVIAFTGAMVPLSMHKKFGSDALPAADGSDPGSLPYTLAHIYDKEPGVYIAARNSTDMRMDFFDPAKYRKDHEASKDRLRYSVMER